MLTLYIKTGCPYCARVLKAGEELGLDFTLKNRSERGVIEELIARGGKRQFPYLIDDSNGTEMYESEDIVDYLHQHYGKSTAE
ncbi:MAG TPA: glutathione S-transferase N-terminal domain-containing protein [Candidatus Paceibacterota bacterium]|jgi:glutaredoxin|nr:glutathione S-transferase N-terminal domain-containing protein [Candidatus Paceibacterota bacterium]